MNLKYTGILFAAALALSVGVSVAGTTAIQPYDAADAARAWALDRAPLSACVGTMVEKTAMHTTTNGANFYAVKMYGGGTVFMSGDCRQAPVVAFTSSPVDYTQIDKRSPLWKMLNGNLSREYAVRAGRVCAFAAAAQAEEQDTRNTQKWLDLIGRSSEMRLYAEATKSGLYPARAAISDVRVEPLVKTQWAQGNVGERGKEWACYNYLTPDGPDFNAKYGGNTKNAVCGCVATAMAQVLKYFEYPSAHIVNDPLCRVERTLERDCYWVYDNGLVVTNENVSIVQRGEGADRVPTPYEWDKMPLKPGVDDKVSPVSEKAEEIGYAIGHLTYDCGVAVGMAYSTDESTAYGCDVPNALKKTFHIGTAVFFSDSENLMGYYDPRDSSHTKIETRTNALQRVMFSNFDAGLPVIVGLYDHEVVADGYGYDEGEPFVHFNMGWAGQNDLWYNIPNLSEAGYAFVEDVTYNIFTNASATLLDPGYACLSGRCLDKDGKPLRNAKITIYEAGTDTQIPGPAPTSASGVWGLAALKVGAYDIFAESEDGTMFGSLLGVELKAPNAHQAEDSRGDEFDCVETDNPEDIGNSWGNDIVLIDPTYVINGQPFQTLDKAIEAVRDGETITILKPGAFEASVTADVSFTLKMDGSVESTNGVVTVAKGVRLGIKSGKRVLFEGVLFDCADDSLVEVEAGGTLALSGEVALPKIITFDATGFELAGEIRPVGGVLYVDCPVAQHRDQQFGTFSCSYPAASACKTNIVNVYDFELGGVAKVEGVLVWDRVADPATAFAKYIEPDAGGRPGESYYNSLTTLFKDCTNNATITILRDCPKELFRTPIVLDKAITITGKGVTPDRAATFTIKEGGKLTLENVTFSNYVGSCLFKVDGGELVLGSGATLTELSSDNEVIDEVYGTTAVLNGRLMMLPGARITNCQASSGYGGGIYVLNGVLDLQGGEITGCLAAKAGGGVYAYTATNGPCQAEVKLSGNLVINDNYSGSEDNIKYDDLCLYSAEGLPTVTNALTSVPKAIGIRYEMDEDNCESNAFVRIEASLGEPQLEVARSAFFSDSKEGFVARVTEDGKSLFWEAMPMETGECEPSNAAFVVVYDAHPERPYHYANADTTFANIQGDATVVITNYTGSDNAVHHYYRTIEIANRIVLKGADGETDWGIRRHAECPIHVSTGGELILTNVTVSGSYSGGGAYPLIQVEGGKLELQSGADVRSASGNQSRACGGIVVWAGGVFTMQPGSRIYDCQNQYTCVPDTNRGVGGGLLVENATAYFNGGRINGCSTAAPESGAGVCLANEAVAYLQGPLWIWGNGSPANNIVVEDNARLYLAGPIENQIKDRWGTGDSHIGVDPGYRTDTNLVAYVAWEGATKAELEAAAKYFHPSVSDSIKALVCRNATLGCNVLVWSPIPEPIVIVPLTSVRVSNLSLSGGKPSLRCFSDEPGAEDVELTVEIWSTDSLTKPFEFESTKKVKLGDDISLDVQESQPSKFWKVVVR